VDPCAPPFQGKCLTGAITITPSSGFVPLTFAGTRTAFALFGFGLGTSTLQPFVRLSGPAGSSATLLHRCALVEASTS